MSSRMVAGRSFIRWSLLLVFVGLFLNHSSYHALIEYRRWERTRAVVARGAQALQVQRALRVRPWSWLFICLGFFLTKQNLLLINKYEGEFLVAIIVTKKTLLCL